MNRKILFFPLLLALHSCIDFDMAESEEPLAGKHWVCEEGATAPLCSYKAIGEATSYPQLPLIDDFADADSISNWGGKWVASPTASEDSYNYAYFSYYTYDNPYIIVYSQAYSIVAPGNPAIGAKLYINASKKYADITKCDTITYNYASAYDHRFQLEIDGIDMSDAFGVSVPSSNNYWLKAQIVPSELTQLNSTGAKLNLKSVKSMNWALGGGSLSIDSLVCIQSGTPTSSSSSSSMDVSSSSTGLLTGQLTTAETGDTNRYNWVEIEGLKWLSDNVNYGLRASSNYTLEAGYKYCFDDLTANCEQGGGGFYTWAVAMGESSTCNEYYGCVPTGYIQGICPYGWHIPSYSEWSMIVAHTAYGVKSKDTWLSYPGVDSLGLDMDARGITTYDPSSIPMYGFLQYGYANKFWARDEYDAGNAYVLSMTIYADAPILTTATKGTAAQVRCVQDH